MKTFTKILKVLWQLPQAAVGWVLYLIYGRGASLELTVKDATVVINRKFPGGVSLWPYIFLDYYCGVDIAHESGHTIQSKRWGWLYLPVVGLASVIHLWCKHHSIIWDRKSDYYAVWPENEADRLGGVKRDKDGRRYV